MAQPRPGQIRQGTGAPAPRTRVERINFADELPAGSRKGWKAFVEALIAENVNLTLVGWPRTGDIVRDADIPHFYKQAGVIRLLLGIESHAAVLLKTIKTGTCGFTERGSPKIPSLKKLCKSRTATP